MRRGTSLNRLPEYTKERQEKIEKEKMEREETRERVRSKIEDMKMDERLKRQGAAYKSMKEKEADLRMADVIKGIYTDLEKRLDRDSPSIHKKKKEETLGTRKVREAIKKAKQEAEWARKLQAYKDGTAKPYKSYTQREEEAEYFKENERTKRLLRELSNNPQAFEEKMKKEEELVKEDALKGAFGDFQKDELGIEIPPPGHTRPLDEGFLKRLKKIEREKEKPRPPSPIIPAILPFNNILRAKTEPTRKRKQSRSQTRKLSKRAKSANQAPKRMKTPNWAPKRKPKAKKTRPAPARPKPGPKTTAKLFSGRYE
jgi:hypothetical protein